MNESDTIWHWFHFTFSFLPPLVSVLPDTPFKVVEVEVNWWWMEVGGGVTILCTFLTAFSTSLINVRDQGTYACPCTLFKIVL